MIISLVKINLIILIVTTVFSSPQTEMIITMKSHTLIGFVPNKIKKVWTQ